MSLPAASVTLTGLEQEHGARGEEGGGGGQGAGDHSNASVRVRVRAPVPVQGASNRAKLIKAALAGFTGSPPLLVPCTW